MEEIRTIATALYNNASSESRATVIDFFNSIDTDGSGSISKEEFMRYLYTECPIRYSDPTFFSVLDADESGSLDFQEVLAFFYFINYRGVACDGTGCRKFLYSLYFTCARCWEDRKNSYNLCLGCFLRKNHYHEHTEFLDNYAMLIITTRGATANSAVTGGSGAIDVSQVTAVSQITGGSGATGSSQMAIYCSGETRRSKLRKTLDVIGAATTGYQFVSAAASLCTIM